jgi:iron complex transport system substrate-binding protein
MTKSLSFLLAFLAGFLPSLLLAQQPTQHRIVCLSPHLTEIVHALGRGNQVVGVTDYCRWPESVSGIEKVGGLYTLSVEKVLSLRPTILFHSADHRGAIDQLRGFGVKTSHLNTESMEDIFLAISSVGEALGVTEEATKLNDTIRGQLAEVAAEFKDARRLRVLYVVDNSPGELRQIYVLGPGTFLDEMLTLAGCENVMKDSKAHYPLVSREHLIANVPDLVILSKSEDTPQLRAQWLQFLGRTEATAPRFLYLDDPHLNIPGPSVGAKARQLAELIHRERQALE